MSTLALAISGILIEKTAVHLSISSISGMMVFLKFERNDRWKKLSTYGNNRPGFYASNPGRIMGSIAPSLFVYGATAVADPVWPLSAGCTFLNRLGGDLLSCRRIVVLRSLFLNLFGVFAQCLRVSCQGAWLLILFWCQFA